MTTIVPINDLRLFEILFENSDKIPEIHYINLMNISKQYYENFDKIPLNNYIKENEINKDIIKKINNIVNVKNKKTLIITFNFNFIFDFLENISNLFNLIFDFILNCCYFIKNHFFYISVTIFIIFFFTAIVIGILSRSRSNLQFKGNTNFTKFNNTFFTNFTI